MVTLPKTTPNTSPTSPPLVTNSRSSGAPPLVDSLISCAGKWSSMHSTNLLHCFLCHLLIECLVCLFILIWSSGSDPHQDVWLVGPPTLLLNAAGEHVDVPGTTNNIYVCLGSWVVPTWQLSHWTIFKPELNQTPACLEREEFLKGYMMKLHKHSCALTWEIDIQTKDIILCFQLQKVQVCQPVR